MQLRQRKTRHDWAACYKGPLASGTLSSQTVQQVRRRLLLKARPLPLPVAQFVLAQHMADLRNVMPMLAKDKNLSQGSS